MEYLHNLLCGLINREVALLFSNETPLAADRAPVNYNSEWPTQVPRRVRLAPIASRDLVSVIHKQTRTLRRVAAEPSDPLRLMTEPEDES